MLIRNKLTLRFTLLVVAIQLFFSAFIYYFNSLYRQQEFYSRLQGKARLAARLLIKRNLLPVNQKQLLEKGDLITLADERISIFSQDRKLVYTNTDSTYARSHVRLMDRLTPEAPFYYTSGRFEAVAILYPYRDKRYFVFASGYDQSGFAKLENMAMLLLLGNLIVLVLIVFAGWYFASESLSPISAVVRQVDNITASRLDLRVDEGNGQDEIAKLAITFNHMLDRVELAFHSQRNFVSHASHELRTPLATALGALETSLIYDRELSEAKASIASAIEEINNIIDLTNGLLSLTKADSLSKQERLHADECFLEALSLIQSKYKGRQVQVRFESFEEDSASFVAEANMQLLRTAFFNILDNACKYSSLPVQVRLGKSVPGVFFVTITDRGIGIDPQEMVNLCLPLYRGSNGRHLPGYGIGLALTKKIVDLHKGTLSIESVLDQGTSVTVTLPLLPV
jgi:signal transduction histidine kinase